MAASFSRLLLKVLFLWTSITLALPEEFSDTVTKDGNNSLLWGPYRPNLYLGLRPRIPNSLLTGLMWSGSGRNEQDPFQHVRHTCEQDEGMSGYGWTRYDLRTGGTHVINDTTLNLDIIADFAKEEAGQNWDLKIRGVQQAQRDSQPLVSTIFYFGTEQPGSTFSCINDGKVVCEGESPELGAFRFRISSTGARTHDVVTWPITVSSETVLPDSVRQAKAVFLDRKLVGAGATPPGTGNLHFAQIVHDGNFGMTISFSLSSQRDEKSSDIIEAAIIQARSQFSTRFEGIYSPNGPFQTAEYTKFSHAMLSNLMGGIGYFYGTSKVDTSNDPAYKETNENFWSEARTAQKHHNPVESGPFELLSTVPSRSFFPRGFLWDEGFHLQVILDWDMDLALEIMDSWFNLMDENGWIAREQILGEEARSKVDTEFQTQYPHYANPPTLFLVVSAFLDRLKGTVEYHGAESQYLKDDEIGHAWLAKIYPKLKLHYGWFSRTQAGDLRRYQRRGPDQYIGYRWRGRTPQLTLTSGLDDYPRAQPPHPEELHVDALSWVGLMAKVLDHVSGYLHDNEAQEMFAKHHSAAIKSLDALHWSELDNAYCDTTMVDGTLIQRVCHKGYVSLFPFLAGLLEPEHEHLESILLLIRDPEEGLWSPYGLRSLSPVDEYYEKGENYWRSPIWVNINWMALEQLLDLSQQEGPHQSKAKEVYTDLRKNIVSTVFNSWKDTGFAWEQYNPNTGKGQRTQHFTGWTSLVVRIMAMPDLDAPPKKQPPVAFQQQPSGMNNVGYLPVFLSCGFFMFVFIGKKRIMSAVSAFGDMTGVGK